ncbi:DMT family transporter [Streptomyces caniferus]|uniref:DMT family transporter n=1 Tax=Streptomyces caniferus TaxID=285557 RepID=UPI003454AD82
MTTATSRTTRPGNRPLWLIDVPVVLVAVVWGSSYLAAKELATTSTVIALLLLRFLVATPVMAVVAGRGITRLSAREIGAGAVLGMLLSGVLVLETFGVVHTSATNAGLIISLTMIFTPLAESVATRTRPTGAFLGAAALSVTGVALLTQGSGFTTPSAGDLLMLLAAVARTVHVMAMSRMKSLRSTDSGALTVVQFLGAIAVFALASPFAAVSPVDVAAAYSPQQWAALLYLALMCTLFAFFVQMWAVRRTSPSRVSLLLGTEPLWAAVIGVAAGGDRPGLLGAAGAVLVLIGTTWGRQAAAPPAAAEDGPAAENGPAEGEPAADGTAPQPAGAAQGAPSA